MLEEPRRCHYRVGEWAHEYPPRTRQSEAGSAARNRHADPSPKPHDADAEVGLLARPVAAENAAAAKKAAEPPRRRTRYDKPVAEIVNEAKQTLFDHRLQKAKWAAEEARNPYTSRNPYSRRP